MKCNTGIKTRTYGAVKVTLIIGAAILLVAGLVSFQVFYLPTAASVKGIQEKIRQENQDRQLRKTVAGQLTEFAISLRDFPLEADSAWLSRQLVASARVTGVRVISLLKEEPVETKAGTLLKVDVQLRGDYHQIGALVDSLERSPTFIWIEKLELQPEGQGGLLGADLTLSSISLDPMGS